MSRGINKVILVGNLGKDVELRHAPSGCAVANISIATTHKQKEVEVTEWHKVVLLGKIAENAAKYTKKGSKIYIEGKLQTRKWEKDGVEHYTTEVLAIDIQFLDRKETAKDDQDQKLHAEEFVDEDIPF